MQAFAFQHEIPKWLLIHNMSVNRLTQTLTLFKVTFANDAFSTTFAEVIIPC